jgi:hypothetical protein
MALERERLELDHTRERREGRFASNPAFLSVAISLAAVLVSGSQVLVAVISKEKELQLAERRSLREFDLNRAKFLIENKKAWLGGDAVENQRTAMLLQTVLPPDLAEQIIGTATHVREQSSSGPLSIEKNGGDGQIIPSGGWKTFAVRVVDGRKQAVHGAKVAWYMPAIGPFTYVGETNAVGIATATNMATFGGESAGHTQIAQVAAHDTPVGFTDGNKITKIGEPVKFAFSFGSK